MSHIVAAGAVLGIVATTLGYCIGVMRERLRADERHQEQLAAIRLARDSARSELIAAKLRIAELTRVYPFEGARFIDPHTKERYQGQPTWMYQGQLECVPVSPEDERVVDELMAKRAAKLSERPMRVPPPTVPVATVHHEGPVFPSGEVDPCDDDPEAA